MGNCLNHDEAPPSQLQRSNKSIMSSRNIDKKRVFLRDFLSLGEIGRVLDINLIELRENLEKCSE